MEALLFNFYLFALLNSLLILNAHGVNIQVYKHPNFTGLVWESNSTGHCNNVPQDNITDLYSIRTDTCFIVYNDHNCKSVFSEKYQPGDINLSSDQLGRTLRIRSFHTCNEKEGGNQLNVDITHYCSYGGLSSDVLQSYKNVCSCVNVPQSVQSMSRWSIDNHHNALLAYYEPDCSMFKWNPKFVAAGHNDASTNMYCHWTTDSVTKTTYQIQSFGPDPNSTYFQASCNTFPAMTTGHTQTFLDTTESVTDPNASFSNKTLSSQIAELQTKYDQLKENQEKFHSEMLQQFLNLIYYLNLICMSCMPD